VASPLLKALIDHFDSVFEGPNGDYPAVLEALEGVTALKAASKPAPACNSIWQIANHLTASKEWQMDILKHGEAAAPVWPQRAGDERAWQAEIARLKEAHGRLRAALEEVREETLLTVPGTGSGETQLELLLSSASHEACHAGQIDYLKGLHASTTGKPT